MKDTQERWGDVRYFERVINGRLWRIRESAEKGGGWIVSRVANGLGKGGIDWPPIPSLEEAFLFVRLVADWPEDRQAMERGAPDTIAVSQRIASARQVLGLMKSDDPELAVAQAHLNAAMRLLRNEHHNQEE